MIRTLGAGAFLLLKLPFLLSTARCTYIIATPPPQTPPAAAECLTPKGLERMGPYILPVLLKYLWIPAQLIEAVTLFACDGGDNDLSRSVRNLLANGPGTCARIQITPLFIISWLSAIIGTSIRYSAYRHLGEMFTFELALRKNRQLITSGPYSVVRHPGYSGGLLALAGILSSMLCPGSWFAECSGHAHSWLAIGAAWAPLLVASGLSFGRVDYEDAMVREGFGDEWVKWSKDVPWKLLPGVY